MDNISFVSVFDNLSLHDKPMDYFTKNAMDIRQGNFQLFMINRKKNSQAIFTLDLEVHRKNGKAEQKRIDNIQQISSSIQVILEDLISFIDVNVYFLMHIRRNNKIFHNPDGHSGPTVLRVNGTTIMIITQWDALCYLYTINLFFQKTKKRKNCKKIETSEITFSASRPDLSMDNNNRKQSQKVTVYSQCFLENKPAKDYQPCIWCINHSLQLG